MIHFKDREKYTLGVYVVDRLENPNLLIRQILRLESEPVLTPQQMSESKAKIEAYVLDASRKFVYSRSNFLEGSDVHIYLEKSTGRVLVRVRQKIIRDTEESHQLVEMLAGTLSENGFRPVHSRIEDIPDICFV
ncbi:hypothetical protein HYT57_04565 [Candidatus Woesearchaeota archaeon]|nr:hypothetical protein [Candidatus Woesearchaeota archaeon]